MQRDPDVLARVRPLLQRPRPPAAAPAGAPVSAYNEPPPGYRHPRFNYYVVMERTRPDGTTWTERKGPFSGSEVDSHVGFMHRSGWQYVSTEQVPGD